MYSRNEVIGVIHKATVASGFPTGLAAEIARAATALSAAGLDGLNTALVAIAPGPSPVAVPIVGDTAVFERTAIANVGPSVIDLLDAGNIVHALMHDVDAPLLFVAMAALRAEEADWAMLISWADTSMMIENADSLGINAATLAAMTDGGSVDVRLSTLTGGTSAMEPNLAPAAGTPAQLSSQLGIELDPQDFEKLETLARQTYVPSSEHSRSQGAGAGLTDND